MSEKTAEEVWADFERRFKALEGDLGRRVKHLEEGFDRHVKEADLERRVRKLEEGFSLRVDDLEKKVKSFVNKRKKQT
jgi:hypothetical protein